MRPASLPKEGGSNKARLQPSALARPDRAVVKSRKAIDNIAIKGRNVYSYNGTATAANLD